MRRPYSEASIQAYSICLIEELQISATHVAQTHVYEKMRSRVCSCTNKARFVHCSLYFRCRALPLGSALEPSIFCRPRFIFTAVVRLSNFCFRSLWRDSLSIHRIFRSKLNDHSQECLFSLRLIYLPRQRTTKIGLFLLIYVFHDVCKWQMTTGERE